MAYIVRVPLVIFRIDKAVAGEHIVSPLSTSSTPTSSPQGSLSELLAGSHASVNTGTEGFDALRYYCISPVAADGTKHAFEYWPRVDGVELRSYQDIDGSADTNMAPWPNNTQGGPYGPDGELVGGLEIGKSLWSLVKYDPLLAIKPVGRNVSLKATGLKASESLQAVGLSSDGWDFTTGGTYDNTKGTAAVVMIMGEIWTNSLADAMAARWNAQIGLQFLDRQINGDTALAAAVGATTIALDTWDELPGGVNQRGTSVNRLIRWSRNSQATTESTVYQFTQSTTPLHGASNNVGNDRDLGFPYNVKSNLDKAFWLQQLGIHVASSGPDYLYFQAIQDGKQIPQSTAFDNGLRINRFQNPQNYGTAQPMVAGSNVYDSVPYYPGKLLVYQNNTVLGIKDNGTSIPADVVNIAIAGPLVEGIKGA